MEEDYQKSLEQIFSYGYRCCVFKHNIYGDLSEISDGMPDSANPLLPKFFVNLRCPPGPNSHRGQGYKDRSGRSDEGSGGGYHCRGTWLISFPVLVLVILGDFCKGHRFAISMRIMSCNHWCFFRVFY